MPNMYVLIADTTNSLTPSELLAVRQAMAQLGPHDAAQPADAIHARISLDGQQAIVQADFDAADLDGARLATLLGDALQIDAAAAAARLSVTPFADVDSVRSFLRDNAAAWESSDQ